MNLSPNQINEMVEAMQRLLADNKKLRADLERLAELEKRVRKIEQARELERLL